MALGKNGYIYGIKYETMRYEHIFLLSNAICFCGTWGNSFRLFIGSCAFLFVQMMDAATFTLTDCWLNSANDKNAVISCINCYSYGAFCVLRTFARNFSPLIPFLLSFRLPASHKTEHSNPSFEFVAEGDISCKCKINNLLHQSI